MEWKALRVMGGEGGGVVFSKHMYGYQLQIDQIPIVHGPHNYGPV